MQFRHFQLYTYKVRVEAVYLDYSKNPKNLPFRVF
jgi:hypothetical protein